MYRIKTMNKIASAGLDQLDKSRFQVGEDVENEDGILVRSAKMHDYVFPDALRAIARAGAGTNNIPIDRCSESGIVVFNTPGANANAVKELVIAALLIWTHRKNIDRLKKGTESKIYIWRPVASRRRNDPDK